MNTVTYIFGITSALLLLFVVIELLRRGKLREKHAIWWIFAGTLGLVVGFFPGVLDWAAKLFGIEIPINLAFL